MVWAAVLGIMVMSLGLECWALTRDLPYPDVDEPTFVRPAVHIASTGDLDPHWFGHPGSTTIYPIAGLYHAWDVVAHGAPVFSPNPTLAQRFKTSPTAFFIIGRLWSIAFAVAAIPLVFLLGRRCFSTAVGLVGATLWALLPIAVSYGRVVRSDSAGVFFALLALLVIVRVVERPTLRNQVLAGVAIGAGISSRYFLVTLLPVLVAAGVIALRRRVPGASIRGIAAGVGAAITTFVVTTPYFFLDWTTAWHSVAAENGTSVGHDGLSPLGNLRWYLGSALPRSLSWPVALLVVAGIVLVLRRPRDVRRLLLVGASVTFVVAIGTSKLHWERWPLPIMPVLVLLAAHAAFRLGSAVHARAGQPIPGPAFAAAAVALVAFAPATSVIRLNQRESRPSTRVLASRWIEEHIPDGSSVVRELKTAPLYDPDLHVFARYSLPGGGWTIDRYRRDGFRYFVTNAGISSAYMSQPRRYPAQAALYRELRREGCLLRKFHANAGRYGPLIRVYELPAPNHARCKPIARA